MVLINSDRRRRILLLSKRLDEFAAARRELVMVRQLVDLDAQASAARLELDYLHDLEAPISYVPDEVLAMIFEEGMHPLEDSDADHFGVLVSHVTQHWRIVSISTPKLWNSIRCIFTSYRALPYPQKSIGRASTFLSRTRSLPLNIHIEGFREGDLSSNFLQLIGDHIERCSQLRIVNTHYANLTRLLEVISPRPMHLLASIGLASRDYPVNFKQQLFPSGVPRLTTATIVDADIFTVHFYLPAFQSLTSLRLRGELCVHIENNQTYQLFRDALMALPALRHLELSIDMFATLFSRLPILLPSIQHLHVQGSDHDVAYCYLDNLLRCIQAPYLVALSLSTWNATVSLRLLDSYERHFPSLQHLVLTGIATRVPTLMSFARAFPCIERLTFKPGRYSSTLLHTILGTILCNDSDRPENSAHSGRLWPKLHSIAYSTRPARRKLAPTTTKTPIKTSREHLDVPMLKSTILKLQAAGHPIRKLLLPQAVHPAMVEMRGTVELEDFYVDWPTPFDW